MNKILMYNPTKVRKVGKHLFRLGILNPDEKTKKIMVDVSRIEKLSGNRYPCENCNQPIVLNFLVRANNVICCRDCHREVLEKTTVEPS